MAFQAPYDIVDMRNQMMREDLARQEQQQQYMGMISGALGDLANMYQKNEEMKAGVKAGEQFGKMFGKQFGLDPAIFNSPEYKGMPMQAKYQLNQGILSNFGSLAQSYNFGRGAEQRQQLQTQRLDAATRQPIVRATVNNQQDVMNQGGPSIGGATRRFNMGGNY